MSPKLVSETGLQIQEAQRTPSRKNTEQKTNKKLYLDMSYSGTTLVCDLDTGEGGFDSLHVGTNGM